MVQLINSSGIRDNYRRGSVADFLKTKIVEGAHLSIVSAYFTIYAYEALKETLDQITHLNFLFGEPRFIRSLDPNRTEKKAFVINDTGLTLSRQLTQSRVARECAAWIQAKVDIRSVKQANFLHGKMYHIAHQGIEEAILGSSNFTVHGLGLSTQSNIELNLEVDSNRDRRDLKAWFDEIWNDEALVADVKAEVLLYLAQLYQNHAPEFIYYKTLFHLFEQYLGDTGKTTADLGKTTLFDSEIWKALFEFQKDGVKGIINKILNHNGCILADSVGLGKTYVALAVIKYFELRNERVLVLCPKKLRPNWTVYRLNDQLNPFGADRFRYDVLSHTDLSRTGGHSGDIDLSTINWGNYDLVVIDESHNFRNNAIGKRDEDGNVIRQSRYERLMDEIIKAGVRTKVLLLSATPVNNDLKDLRNQIYFITAGSDDALQATIGIANIKETLRQAQGHFSNWAKLKPEQRKTNDLMTRLGADFFKLLDNLTIARSRKHIQRYYAREVERLGNFPERLTPLTRTPEIDTLGKFLAYDRLSQEIDGYKLSLFNPSRFVLTEYKGEYEKKLGNFTQAQREDFLIGMMKVNFLKRLESSVHSFESTMQRTIAKIDELQARIERFRQLQQQNPELDFDELTPEALDDTELADALEVGKKLKFKLAHLDLDDWTRELNHDRAQLKFLHDKAAAITPLRDAKLAELKELIAAKVRQPTVNKLGQPNRKVLVFTAFADTAQYLYTALHEWARQELGVHSALVVGSGNNRTTFQPAGYTRHTEFNHILTNFSPLAKRRAKIPTMPQTGEIDLLIATDCISEGQNLQDCDFLINYDIHWNPVRIIQRFGRIDRIGSQNFSVQLVNFWPTPNLDQYISLKHRVEARMALVDIAATNEDNLLRPAELEELITEDLKYRDKQLLRLKDEVLDLEDLTESVSLTDFTLDDFRVELLKYLEANRNSLEGAGLGLYAVVPPHPNYPLIAPGVIFCLRQKTAQPATPNAAPSAASSTEIINPLQPYFLVYILADGNVRLGFAQPKQILEIYRLLCAEQQQPYDALCLLFDQKTQQGQQMEEYTGLLNKAITAITTTFRRRMAGGLQTGGRGFVLPKQSEQVHEATDFELITWLVILS